MWVGLAWGDQLTNPALAKRLHVPTLTRHLDLKQAKAFTITLYLFTHVYKMKCALAFSDFVDVF